MANKPQTQPKAAEKEQKSPGFEEALKKLEDAVRQLESGELTLDEALARCEEGVRACKLCYKLLEEAETRIRKLVETDNGDLRVEPFEETDEQQEA